MNLRRQRPPLRLAPVHADARLESPPSRSSSPRAEGNELIDTDGRRYLDGVSSLWVNVHGHHRRELDDAVRAQLDRVAHSTLLGLGNVPSIELAERLVRVAPPGLHARLLQRLGLDRRRGRAQDRLPVPEAARPRREAEVPRAHRGLSRRHRRRGQRRRHRPLPRDLPSAALSRPPRRTRRSTRSSRCSTTHAHELAAFIVEPLVQGAAGMLMQPPGFLRAARELCTKHDVLLICDEVATGFGRTGTMFACEQEEVAPDLMCLAKGISGGYLPLAATLATRDHLRGLPRRIRAEAHILPRPHLHGQSARLRRRDRLARHLRARPRARAPAAEDRAPARAPRRAARAADAGRRDPPARPHDRRRARAPTPTKQAIGARVCLDLRARGVLLRPLGNVIVMMPPLSITDDEIDRLVDAHARLDRRGLRRVNGLFVTATDTGVGKTCGRLRAGPRRRRAAACASPS